MKLSTGTVGVGKASDAGMVGDLLIERGIVNAVIDLATTILARTAGDPYNNTLGL